MKSLSVILFLVMISSTVMASLSARKASLAKDLYEVLLTETEESFQADLKEGLVFKESSLTQYEAIVQELCQEFKAPTCPRVYFTSKESNQIAANYPNSVLQINKKSAQRLNKDEMTFILAHEFAHHFLAHSKLRIEKIADIVVENSIVVTEESTTLATAFLYPGVLEYHHQSERDADDFAFSYIAQKGLHINCSEMFKKILNGEQVSTDQHDLPTDRCR
jgi:Zn-dependent protease with chaperone function